MSENGFGKLGQSFQMTLIQSLIEDRKYGDTIVDFIEINYFDNSSFKFIVKTIKDFYDEFKAMPTFESLRQKIVSENNMSTTIRGYLDTLDNISKHEVEGVERNNAKKLAINFCRQQNLIKTIKQVEKIIDDGYFQRYDDIEKMIQKALQVGVINSEIVDVFDDIEATMAPDSRVVVPTGISGLDDVLKGGLGKGELGIVLAPTGTGKTTILTKFSNTAFNENFNVVQIFFEDNVTAIKKKHYTIWSGVSPDDQPYDSEIINTIKKAQEKSKGKLKLIKLPSDSITVNEIKSRLRKMFAEGFNVDLLVIDYVDCITPEKGSGGNEEWKGEGAVMRGLEAMCSEFGIAIWTATQGNRDSIMSEVVTTNQMGGSIKKAQVGHVILSIGKTIDQKEHNLGTITLLKSRIGKDGVIWSNAKFDNEYLVIDTNSTNTFLGHKEDKEKEKQDRIRRALANKKRVEEENRLREQQQV